MRGLFITLLVLAPNAIIFVRPAIEVPPPLPADRAPAARYMQPIERLGQVGVFTIPLFYTLELGGVRTTAAMAVMALALLFYYAGWVRYVRGGHRFGLLFAPMLGVPLPMAVAPIVYFAAASLALMSWPLAAATIVLAVGHLYMSEIAWTAVREAPPAPAEGPAAESPTPPSDDTAAEAVAGDADLARTLPKR